MALYHFTVKNDKHPGTKKQIKATLHIDYINREGKYKNEGERLPQDMDNVISSTQKADAVSEKTWSLYSSPFGKITNTEKGLALTEDPSYDTISIALMMAKKTMKEPLTVNGSTAFRAKCIQAAVLGDLPITFEDASMQSILDKKRKEKNDEREQFRRQGGKVILRKNIPKPNPNKDQRIDAHAPSIRALPTVRQLPKLHVVRPKQEDAALPLPAAAGDLLGHLGTERNPPVRWDLSDGRRQYAERTARRILANFARQKDTISALRHVEYINREKGFSERGDCVYKQHRLPAWAKGSPTVFFRAADRYSPKNAARYKNLAKELGLNAVFTGAQKSAARFYEGSELFLFPTAYEPFSNVVLEALSYGCVAITTAQNGAAEILPNDFVMSSPQDYDICALIDEILNDDERLAMLQERNLALASEFSIEKNASATLEIIRANLD